MLPPTETELADVVTLQRRAAATVTDGDADAFFQDTLMEYLWARDVAGLAPTTLHRQVQPVVEVCDFYDLPPWQITPRHLDQYFAGVGKRAPSTLRGKLLKIDGYFHFLEQRYAGEIARRFGVAVESPVDAFNRPVTVGTSGCGYRRRSGRRRSSSPRGAVRCRTRGSTRWPAGTM
ncbi:hypothetical protein [Streptomyces sp. NPDC046860]|uniref:hypothetical protein n=1 Tax=Streptomyces sp. NPDC046860 TaxID=3154495 RepID=UPI0033DC5C3C